MPINLNPPQLSELSEATVVVVPPWSYSELHKTSHLLELQPDQDRQWYDQKQAGRSKTQKSVGKQELTLVKHTKFLKELTQDTGVMYLWCNLFKSGAKDVAATGYCPSSNCRGGIPQQSK